MNSKAISETAIALVAVIVVAAGAGAFYFVAIARQENSSTHSPSSGGYTSRSNLSSSSGSSSSGSSSSSSSQSSSSASSSSSSTSASSSSSSSSTSSSSTITINTSLLPKNIFAIPVVGRMHSFGQWALPGETPASVGSAFASYNPTYVSLLIRFQAGAETMTAQMISEYDTVRNAVLAVNPNCKFDLSMRPEQYADATALANGIAAVLANPIQFDAIFFNGYNAADASKQAVMVNNAHAGGKLAIGGIVEPENFTAGMVHTLPDAFASHSEHWVVPPTTSLLVSYGIPVLFYPNSDPIPVDSKGNTENYNWCNVFTTAQRKSYISQFFNAAPTWGYNYVWPLFYPVKVVGPPTQMYDANADDAMVAYQQQLIATGPTSSVPVPGTLGVALFGTMAAWFLESLFTDPSTLSQLVGSNFVQVVSHATIMLGLTSVHGTTYAPNSLPIIFQTCGTLGCINQI